MPVIDVEHTHLDSSPQTARTGTPMPFSQPQQRPGEQPRRGVILLVEDDRGDQVLIQEALRESGGAPQVMVVSDGEEALQYLHRCGRYEHPSQAPRPDLILLDLNMPKLNGRQVAARAKSDATLRGIPIVVLSTSDYPEDVASCYYIGVNSYVHKPMGYTEFARTIGAIERYWLQVTEPAPR
jgi:CheY-like chemotaxis protein